MAGCSSGKVEMMQINLIFFHRNNTNISTGYYPTYCRSALVLFTVSTPNIVTFWRNRIQNGLCSQVAYNLL